MDIKIQCNCGTKYKFEFEPVNGRIPFAVKCPTCGTDATEFANSHIQPSAGSDPTMLLSADTPAIAPAEPRLRVRVHTPADEPAFAHAPAVSAPAPRFSMPPPVTAYTPVDEGLGKKFFMGLLGGLLGVLVGCAIWFSIFHFTGVHLRLLALLVGAAGGFGAKLLSKDEGSAQLGMITVVFTLVGIVFTAYFIGRERSHNFVGGLEGNLYKEQVAYAKRAVKSVPDGADEQKIRLFLAKEEADGGKPDLSAVDVESVRHFREIDFAHYQQLASGKVLEADYFKTQRRWEHEEEVASAARTLAAMPNGSDAEIRVYLASEQADEGDKVNPKSISSEEIQQFRTEELPHLKALANGEVKFEETPEDSKKPEAALNEVESESGPWVKFLYFFAGWGIGGIGIMFVTLGMTYKICTHGSD